MKKRQIIQGLMASLMFPLIASLSAPAAEGKVETDIKALLARMKQGGYVIVFRHGATNRDQADTDPLNYNNVDKQRLLSKQGRQQASQISESFKQFGIPLGKIYTSKFNRAVETGKMISGRDVITTIDVTEGGLVVSPIENDRRAEALRRMVMTMPEAKTNTLIVTHKPNIIDAFGKDWFDLKEGEASVFKPDSSSKMVFITRLKATDWITVPTVPDPE